MREICLPIDQLDKAGRTELDVRHSGNNPVQSFRLETIDVEITDGSKISSEQRIERLKNYISTYSLDWELIQILDFEKDTHHIQLLYRKRT